MLQPVQLLEVLRQLATAHEDELLQLPEAQADPLPDPLPPGDELRLAALLESNGVPSKWLPQAQLVATQAFSGEGSPSVGDLRRQLSGIRKSVDAPAASELEVFTRRAEGALTECLPSMSAVAELDGESDPALRDRFVELAPLFASWPASILNERAWNTIESPLPGAPDLPLTETWISLRLRRLRVGETNAENDRAARVDEVLRSRFYGEPVDDVIRDIHQLTCVLGQPGAGKSTLVRWLARYCVIDESSPFLVPIHIPLRSYSLALEQRPDLTLFQYFLERRGVTHGGQVERWQSVRDQLTSRSSRGQGLFFWLIDGWDEVPLRLRERVRGELERIQHEPGIVTTRHAAVPYSLPCQSFYEILPLSRPAQHELMEAWLQAMGRGDAVDEVRRWLDGSSSLRELASSPFLLTLVCGIATQPSTAGRLQEVRSRYDLYERALEAIMAHHTRRYPASPFDGSRRRQVERFASWLFFDVPGAPRWVFDRSDVEEGSGSDDVFDTVLSPSRLICAPTPDSTTLQFLHATLQEFLVATGLIESGLGELLEDPLAMMGHSSLVEVLRFVSGERQGAAATALWNAVRDAIDTPDDYGLLYARAALLLAEGGIRDGGKQALGLNLCDLLWESIWKYRHLQPAVLIDAHMALDADALCRQIFRAVAREKSSLPLVMVVLEQAPKSLLETYAEDPEVQSWLKDPDLSDLFGVLFGEVLGHPTDAANGGGLGRMHAFLGAGDSAAFLDELKRHIEQHRHDPEVASEAIELAGELGSPAVGSLTSVLTDTEMHPALRSEAAQSLAECGPEGVAILEQQLILADEDELLFAVLGAVQGNWLTDTECRVVRHLMTCSEDAEVRDRAVILLETSRTSEATEWLMEAFAAEADFEVRRSMLDALGFRGDDRAALWLWERLDGDYQGSEEERGHEREATFKSLCEIASRNRHRWSSRSKLRQLELDLVTRLKRILGGADRSILEAATFAAARFPEIPCSTLVGLMGDGELPDALRMTACMSLGDRRESESASALGAQVEAAQFAAASGPKDADESVPRAAAEALALIDPELLAGLLGPAAERMRAVLAFDRGMLFFGDDSKAAKRTKQVMASEPQRTPGGFQVPADERGLAIFDLLTGKAMRTEAIRAELQRQRLAPPDTFQRTMTRMKGKSGGQDFGIRHHPKHGYYREDAPPPALRGLSAG